MASATAVAIVIQRGRVLMIKSPANGERFAWQFPLGVVAAAEDPQDAAVRETREQVGLRVQPSSVLGERFVEAISKRLVYVACTPLGLRKPSLPAPAVRRNSPGARSASSWSGYQADCSRQW